MKRKLLLRLDPGVYEALKHWAGEDLRSLNGHIEYLLRQALVQAGRINRPAPPEEVRDV